MHHSIWRERPRTIAKNYVRPKKRETQWWHLASEEAASGTVHRPVETRVRVLRTRESTGSGVWKEPGCGTFIQPGSPT